MAEENEASRWNVLAAATRFGFGGDDGALARWHGERKQAEESSFLQRCVKKTRHPEGEYRSPESGEPIRAERFPMFGRSSTELREYGCSVAVNLFLRFNLEAAALFFVMFLVSIYQAVDSWDRNTLRKDCRAAVTANYDAAVSGTWNSSLSQQCGYQNLETDDGAPAFVRQNLKDLDVSVLMRFSLGACEEYTNVSDQVLFSPASDVSNGRPLAATPNADFCVSGSNDAIYWLSALNVVIFLGYLVRLRRLQFQAARSADKAMWTAADYSVMINGLIKGGIAHEEYGPTSVEAKLREDMDTLGFKREYIDHIEMGVTCADEIAIAQKVERLEIKKEELLAREKARQEKGQPAQTDSTKEKVGKVDERLDELRKELEDLQDKDHVTTGHAFIVFKFERHRNQFVNLFRRSFWQRIALNTTFAERLNAQELPTLLAAGSQPVLVMSAPEPSDVFWENLAKDLQDTNKASMVTLAVTSVLIGMGVGIQVLIKYTQAQYTPEKLADRGTNLTTGEASAFTLSLSAVASTVVVLINLLLKWTIKHFVGLEGHDTKTDFERRVFTMLSMAYVLNTVVMPMVLGAVPFGVTQAWYEEGGVVAQAFLLIVTNFIFVEGLKVFQIYPFVMRYLVAPFAISQKRKNELWAPPRLLMGDLYAGAVKTVALCVFYAPLFPFAYLLTSIAFITTFWCTKFAVVFWYHKPPHVDDDMMDRMRTILSLCIFGQLLSMFIAGGRASPSDNGSVYGSGTGWAAFLWALICWLLYAGLPLGLIPCLRDYEQTGNDFDATDTMDIPYDKVTELKHYEIEHYECPAARRGDVVVGGQSRRLAGAPARLPPIQPFPAEAYAPNNYPPQPTASTLQQYPQAVAYPAAGSYPPTTQQQTCYPPQPAVQREYQDI